MSVIGVAALPLAYRFFRHLPDRGYAFARPLGLLLTSYLLWLGASLGILRNNMGGALLCVLLVAAASLIVYHRRREPGSPGLFAWLRSNVRLVVAVELLFGGAWVLWALIRAYSPDLTTAGGEKFMEIMYLNSISRSEFFPPHDAWLSGYAISYYYFGYVMIAMLSLLSGFAAHLTFNVGVALLFALTCTGAFGLVYNLVKGDSNANGTNGRARPIAFGFLGAILVAVLGNLEGFLESLYSARLLPEGFWRWLDIRDINQPFDLSAGPSLIPTRSGWWWWRASRVIHDLDPLGDSMGIQPIDEFPGFSFLLGDMHPHVLALPFVLLALAVALQVMRREMRNARTGTESHPWLPQIEGLSLLVPICLGALGFLNTWDLPVYLGVLMAAYGLGRWQRYGRWGLALLRDVVVMGALVGVVGALLYLPFYIGFQSQAGGILPTLYVGTRLRQYFVMFGPFIVAIIGLLVVSALGLRRRVAPRRLLKSWLAWTVVFILGPLAVMLLVVLGMIISPQGREFLEGIRQIPFIYAIVGDDPWVSTIWQLLLVKLRTWAMPLMVAAVAAMGTTLLQYMPAHTRASVSPTPGGGEESRKSSWRSSSKGFVLVCAVIGLLLTLSVEFVYLVDVFRVRINTVFKFYFQAWVLMAVASAYGIYWLSRKRNWLRLAFQVGFWVLFLMGMVYPVLGNYTRAGNFEQAPRLDGTAYLATSEPEDYAAITWLNRNVEGAPIILEAPGVGGSSYVYEGRVSALTGLPTLLGWAGHEGQWRGSYSVQDARAPDIEIIYNSLDPQAALALMDIYGITYVYVGPLESSKYDQRGLAKFQQFMDIVYQQDDVTIYQRRE
jgi:YYY domain-containing protein